MAMFVFRIQREFTAGFACRLACDHPVFVDQPLQVGLVAAFKEEFSALKTYWRRGKFEPSVPEILKELAEDRPDRNRTKKPNGQIKKGAIGLAPR